jgi:hypothetical protein
MSYKIITLNTMLMFFPVTAFLLIALFIWFLVMLLMIRKNSLSALSYLRLFAVSFLAFFLIRAIFVILTTVIKSKFIPADLNQPVNTILQCAEKMPYLFLIPFFIKYALRKDPEPAGRM